MPGRLWGQPPLHAPAHGVPQMGHSAWLQGGHRAWKLSQQARSPAAGLNLPCLLKQSLLETLSGVVRWCSGSLRTAGQMLLPERGWLDGLEPHLVPIQTSKRN